MGQLYTAKDFIEFTKINQETLTQWLRGYVVPDVKAERSGTPNKYEAATICQIVLFKNLLTLGFSRKQASIISFHKAVKDIFRHIINFYTVKNVLSDNHVREQPLFQLAHIEYKDGKQDFAFLPDQDSFSQLHEKAVKADRVIIFNLTEIVKNVLHGLKVLK